MTSFFKPFSCFIILSFIFVAFNTKAQRAFTLRQPAFNLNGDLVLIGNRVLTGASATKDNEGTTMSYVDLDGNAATTVNSSSADLNLPSGSVIIWAGLYWGGRSNNAARNKIKFRKSTDAVYSNFTATQLDNGNTISDLTGEDHYACFVDVTAYVKSKGTGTYWAGDVLTYSGTESFTGYYGGWALAVVYSNPLATLKNITVFDGYNAVYSTGQTIFVSGFLTPPVSGFVTKIGWVAYEGDLYKNGDRLRLNANNSSNNVYDANNPNNNIFNGTISSTPRSPNTTNNWGVDFDYITSNISLPTNANSTNIYLGTSGDLFIPSVIILTTDQMPGPLPVELISFEGASENHSVVLHWATAAEKNNSHFIIQRSTDNLNWQEAGRVAGSGTITSLTEYSFKDESAFDFMKKNNASKNIVYYRLRQVDYNGSAEDSKTIFVKLEDTTLGFEIYPNPAKSVCFVNISKSEALEVNVTLLSSGGNRIKNLVTSSQLAEMDITSVKTGVYFIEVYDGLNLVRKKILVQ